LKGRRREDFGGGKCEEKWRNISIFFKRVGF
jgi:hypothetical protein